MPKYKGQCWDLHEPSWKLDTRRHYSEPYVLEEDLDSCHIRQSLPHL